MKTTKVVLQTHTIKRTSLIENLKKHWQLFLFLILPLLYIIIFAYGPMMGLQIAFKDFDAAKGVWGSPWVGLKHFKNLQKKKKTLYLHCAVNQEQKLQMT